MHITTIITKDGKKYNSVLWTFRPAQNFFTIIDNNQDRKFSFDEVKSVITKGERISVNKIGDIDEIERARKFLKDGRKFKWSGIPKEKFDWE